MIRTIADDSWNAWLYCVTNSYEMRMSLKKIYQKLIKANSSQKLKLISQYRELDSYELDLEIFPKSEVFIPKKLPSEPEEGITYRFGPTGFKRNINSDFCVIPTEWKNVNNYCHWTFAEIPLLHLAFSSSATNIVLPSALINVKLSFQARWFEILKKKYPGKKILSISKAKYPSNSFIPINHDTSNNEGLIGKCPYKYYHHSRATPYLIEIINYLKPLFDRYRDLNISRFYINRKTRRLRNENEVQKYLNSIGYSIVNLEDLTLDDQVHLFSSASEIIGFHGAGLTNLLFCNNDVKVIEIVDKDCVHPAYLDGLVIPGRKATRTYYHMVAHMKNIFYQAVETENYYLDIEKLKSLLKITR